MADDSQDGVHAVGPDGKHYLFPKGTTPDAVIAHFKTPSAAASSSPPNRDLNDQPGLFSRLGSSLGIPTSEAELKAAKPGVVGALAGPAGIAGQALAGYGKQVYQGIKKGAGEVAGAEENIAEGQPVLPNLGKAAYGVTHGLLQAIPGAGPATETAGEDIQDENYLGAAGGIIGATLQAMMLRGGRAGKSDKAMVNKLTYASGESGGTSAALKAVLPDIKDTVKAHGAPKTVGDFQKAVKATSSRLDQQFNSALFRNAHRQVDTTPISNELLSKAANMPPSPEGQAMAQQLTNAAAEYQRSWTLRELNSERMMRNGFLKGFYNKAGSGQMAAMRSSADSIIDQTVAEGARDALYNELDKHTPGADFQKLKLKQSHMIELQDQLDKHIGKLEDAQAAKEGQPLLDKPSLSASGHPGGSIITPRASGLMKLIPGRGPMSSANKAVSSAFKGSTRVISPARAAILGMPITALAGRGKGLPPPPQQDSNDQQ